MAFRSLDKLINLHDGYRRAFRIDTDELLLIQEQGQRWLVSRRCPHAGQTLDDAEVSAGTIRCSRHGYCFSLTDGNALASPCENLATYELVYEGNSVGWDDGVR